MQNVTLPDKDEVQAELPFLIVPLFGFTRTTGTRIAILEAWIQALYAKHGEECPLFKEGGDGPSE